MKNLKWFDATALVLVIIGGLNWGLVGFFSFNLVEAIFGSGVVLRIVYDIVGIAALYLIYPLCAKCKKGKPAPAPEEPEL